MLCIFRRDRKRPFAVSYLRYGEFTLFTGKAIFLLTDTEPLSCLLLFIDIYTESQCAKKELLVFAAKCVGCGACAKICTKAHTPACTACGACVAACTHGARKIAGEKLNTEEIFKTVQRDIPFYESSGGGVTLSGGEPLLQAGAAAALLAQCRAAGIHTAP